MANEDTEFEKEIKNKISYLSSGVGNEKKNWRELYQGNEALFSEYCLYSAKQNRRPSLLLSFFVAYMVSFVVYLIVFYIFTNNTPVFFASKAVMLRDIFPLALIDHKYWRRFDINGVEAIVKAIIAALPFSIYIGLKSFVKKIDAAAKKEATHLLPRSISYLPEDLSADKRLLGKYYHLIALFTIITEGAGLICYYRNFIMPASTLSLKQVIFQFSMDFAIVSILFGCLSWWLGDLLIKRKYNTLALVALIIPFFVELALFTLAPAGTILSILFMPLAIFFLVMAIYYIMTTPWVVWWY